MTRETPTITLSVDATTGLIDRRSNVDVGVVDAVIDKSITATIDRDTAAVGDEVADILTPLNNSKDPVMDGAKVVFGLPAAVSPGDIDAPGWSVQVVGNTATFTIDDVLMHGPALPVIEVDATVVDSASASMAHASIATVNGAEETTLGNNADVAGFSVPAPAPQQPSNLPTTGSEAGRLLLPVALALVLAGVVLQFGVRRRRPDGRRRPRTA